MRLENLITELSKLKLAASTISIAQTKLVKELKKIGIASVRISSEIEELEKQIADHRDFQLEMPLRFTICNFSEETGCWFFCDEDGSNTLDTRIFYSETIARRAAGSERCTVFSENDLPNYLKLPIALD